jgi:hypothetical protein
MPNKLGIAFLGMMVGGIAFLISGTAVYLTTAQLQYRSMAQLQDRTMQAQGPAQPNLTQYARLQPTPRSIGFLPGGARWN